MNGPPEILDPAALASLVESVAADADFLAELVETYVDDSAVLLADLTAPVFERDRDRFRRAAHSLKSASATFGATALTERARRLEARAASPGDSGEPLEPLLAGLEHHVADVVAALRRWVTSPSTT